MKRFLFSLLLAFAPLLCMAQNEQDFSSRFMSLYGSSFSLNSTTVSPLMLERMVQLPKVEENEQMRQVLSQLKSIRMLTAQGDEDAPRLYENAKSLAQHNPSRYKLYAEQDGKQLYTRHRHDLIVEVVLFMELDGNFCLINLTGNMNEAFLEQILHI